MSIDFIVLSLPRSGSTWLANLLTTDHSLCLHDPFATALPEGWPRDGRRLGISCTGTYMFPGWLEQQACPVAVIERPHEACDASGLRMGLGATNEHMREMLARVRGRRWKFHELWEEERAKELWKYLLPDAPWDGLRYRLLREMQVQPKTWAHDEGIVCELIERGWHRTKDGEKANAVGIRSSGCHDLRGQQATEQGSGQGGQGSPERPVRRD